MSKIQISCFIFIFLLLPQYSLANSSSVYNQVCKRVALRASGSEAIWNLVNERINNQYGFNCKINSTNLSKAKTQQVDFASDLSKRMKEVNNDYSRLEQETNDSAKKNLENSKNAYLQKIKVKHETELEALKQQFEKECDSAKIAMALRGQDVSECFTQKAEYEKKVKDRENIYQLLKGGADSFGSPYWRYSIPNSSNFNSTNSSVVRVRSYYKTNGSFVNSYYRTSPDSSLFNNFSTKGNINPFTGMSGNRSPWSR